MSRCSLMPLSRRMATTSRWELSRGPTAPSMSSSAPSRMLASGVFSSCDMWRRKRLRSCARSSRRRRSHSSCAPRRSRSRGPGHLDRARERAAAELADGAVDGAQRPADGQREREDGDQRERREQRGLPEQAPLRAGGLLLQFLRAARRSARLPLAAMALARSLSRSMRARIVAKAGAARRRRAHGARDLVVHGREVFEALARGLLGEQRRELRARGRQALVGRAVGLEQSGRRRAPGRAARCGRARRCRRTGSATGARSARLRAPVPGWPRSGCGSGWRRRRPPPAAGPRSARGPAASGRSAIWVCGQTHAATS